MDIIAMRKIAATELKANLATLLGDVERGEVIEITRHGKTIARLEPQSEQAAAEQRRLAVERIRQWRKTLPPTGMTVADILAARDEGRK
jgi:prevent-host-death family protein